MSRLARYIFSQCAGPLVFFTLILSGVVWLSQSLQMLDLVVNRGQSAGTFAYLSILIFPSLLSDVLPIALFSATFYALHHLYNDSELVVMWSAGFSRWGLMMPIAMLALLVMIFNLFLNLYLMPAGYRAMKDKIYEIRSDLATQLIKEGTFTNPSRGLTVYIREATGTGELKGILVHDNRNLEKPTTYLAESGMLVRKDSSPELIMKAGNIQTITDPERPPSFTSFEEYSLDLSPFVTNQVGARREFRERYLSELFNPNLEDRWDQANVARLKSEGHNRLAAPLYNIAFALIALLAVTGGHFNRRGNGWRIVPAGFAVVIIRLGGFAGQNASSSSIGLTFLQYVLPIGTAIICMILISDWRRHADRWGIPIPRLKRPVTSG